MIKVVAIGAQCLLTHMKEIETFLLVSGTMNKENTVNSPGSIFYSMLKTLESSHRESLKLHQERIFADS
jgi:hypothetical protein